MKDNNQSFRSPCSANYEHELQVHYFASFNVAEHIFKTLAPHVGHDLQARSHVRLSQILRIIQQEFQSWGTVYRKGFKTCDRLTSALKTWAENSLRGRSPNARPRPGFPLVMNKTTRETAPPRGAVRSQVSVLGAYNSYDGIIPSSWTNGSPRAKKLRTEMPLDSDSEYERCGDAASGPDDES
jgi:hypothetical protein